MSVSEVHSFSWLSTRPVIYFGKYPYSQLLNLIFFKKKLFLTLLWKISWTRGASIGWHSDDNRPYLKQRDFTVCLCYLVLNRFLCCHIEMGLLFVSAENVFWCYVCLTETWKRFLLWSMENKLNRNENVFPKSGKRFPECHTHILNKPPQTFFFIIIQRMSHF